MASRLVLPATAFATSTRRTKRDRIENTSHERFIRELACVVCGDATTVQCAHISYADPRFGKYGRGKSQREESCWTIPLCEQHHRQQHSMAERDFWKSYGIDPVRVAAALYIRTQDHEAAILILINAMN